MKLLRVRQEEAQKRNAARAQRSDKEQLANLTAAGHGHSREAKRLAASIAFEAQEKKKTGVLSKKTNKGFTLPELIICIWGLVCVAAVIAIGYCVVHFVAKFW